MACNCKSGNTAHENTIKAGRISGNPMQGLCERVVIETKRVLDGCIHRTPSMGYQLQLTDIEPLGLVYPFRFINAVSVGDATIENLTLLPSSTNRARVRADVIIPVSVTFADAHGTIGTARSSITVHRDAFLAVPTGSEVIPYSINASGAMYSDSGTFVNETTVNIICCTVVVLKTTINVDIVIPSYGYCVYPECTTTEDGCNTLMTSPIFG